MRTFQLLGTLFIIKIAGNYANEQLCQAEGLMLFKRILVIRATIR